MYIYTYVTALLVFNLSFFQISEFDFDFYNIGLLTLTVSKFLLFYFIFKFNNCVFFLIVCLIGRIGLSN